MDSNMKKINDIEKSWNSDERHQYPGGIKRVTAGHGGEALLLIGSEKAGAYGLRHGILRRHIG